MKENNRKKLKLLFGLERSLLLLILLFCLSLAIPPVFAQINSPDKIQLIQQGKQYYNSGQFLKAIPLWEQAIEIFPNNSLNQSMALSNLSLTYQQLGEWEKADAAIIKSLKIVQSLKTTTEQQRILAQALDIQGQLQQKTGQSQTALNTWQKAAQLYPNSVDKKINQINQAQVMQDLGLYPRACQTLLQTLDINNQKCQISDQEITIIKQEILANSQNNYKIRALRSLGNVLRVIGDFQKSETILRVSLAIAKQGNSSEDESKALLNLGNTERALRKLRNCP
jgi:tetratricopeptide (TPR) repeat protein